MQRRCRGPSELSGAPREGRVRRASSRQGSGGWRHWGDLEAGRGRGGAGTRLMPGRQATCRAGLDMLCPPHPGEQRRCVGPAVASQLGWAALAPSGRTVLTRSGRAAGKLLNSTGLPVLLRHTPGRGRSLLKVVPAGVLTAEPKLTCMGAK